MTWEIMAQSADLQMAAILGASMWVLWLIIIGLIIALIVFMIIAMWKVFKKAHRKGWEAIIPIWNNYVMTTKVGGRPAYWFWASIILGGASVWIVEIWGETSIITQYSNGAINILW